MRTQCGGRRRAVRRLSAGWGRRGDDAEGGQAVHRLDAVGWVHDAMLTSRPAVKRQTTCQSTSAAKVRAALRFAGTHGYLPERFLHIDTARVALLAVAL